MGGGPESQCPADFATRSFMRDNGVRFFVTFFVTEEEEEEELGILVVGLPIRKI